MWCDLCSDYVPIPARMGAIMAREQCDMEALGVLVWKEWNFGFFDIKFWWIFLCGMDFYCKFAVGFCIMVNC